VMEVVVLPHDFCEGEDIGVRHRSVTVIVGRGAKRRAIPAAIDCSGAIRLWCYTAASS
jgi:site-specific recombinase XerC